MKVSWDGMRVEKIEFPFNPFLRIFSLCSAVLHFNCCWTRLDTVYVFDLCHCILFHFLPLNKLLNVCQKRKYFYFFNTCVQFKVVLFTFYSSMFLARYFFFCTFTWVILEYFWHLCSSLNHYFISTDHQMVPAWCTGLCTTSLINTWTWDCSKLRDRVWRWTSCSFSLKNCLKSLQNSTKPNLLFHK